MEVQNCVASRIAQTKLRKEECAAGMGQRSNHVVVKDVRIKL